MEKKVNEEVFLDFIIDCFLQNGDRDEFHIDNENLSNNLEKSSDESIEYFIDEYKSRGILIETSKSHETTNYRINFKKLIQKYFLDPHFRETISTLFQKIIIQHDHSKDGYDDLENGDFVTLNLFDHSKSFSENIENGNVYMVIHISHLDFDFRERENIIPGRYTKSITTPMGLEDNYAVELNEIFIDPVGKTPFALRSGNFLNYSSFFSCDERVLFETLMFKWKHYKYVKNQSSFFYSIPQIEKDLGIKKRRTITIMDRFKSLGIITSKVIKTKEDGKYRNVTWHTVHPQKVVELVPTIFNKRFAEEEKDIMLQSFFRTNKSK
ncbi:MAG: hypothetical protein R2730_05850 [Chitinophagales bacterium]